MGKIIFWLGIFITIVGLIIMYGHHVPFLGRLPGDIYLEKKNIRFYFPLMGCLVISVLLSLIFYLFKKR